MNASDLVLYNNAVSSYAQKVRIALREKGLPFRTEEPLFSTDPAVLAAWTSASPRKEVPVLTDANPAYCHDDNPVAIADSTLILEYLEDAYPEHALLPPKSDPAARARARTIEDVCDTQYEAVNWGWGEVLYMGRAGEEGSALWLHFKAEVIRQTRELQSWLEEKLGDAEYFGGEYGFGWADAGVAAVLHRSVAYGLPPAEGSKLAEWHNRICERESVKATFKEFEEGLKIMGLAKGMIEAGKFKREYRDHRLEFMVRSGGIGIVQNGMEKDNIRFTWPEGQLMEQ